MVLRTLDALGPLHGYGIARRIEQVSGDEVLLNSGNHLRFPGEASAARVDPRCVGDLRQQLQGEVLFPYQTWPQATDQGRCLPGAAFHCHGPSALLAGRRRWK